jgi:hypothetical protein
VDHSVTRNQTASTIELVQASIRLRDATLSALLASRRRIKRTRALLNWGRQRLPNNGSAAPAREVETIRM